MNFDSKVLKKIQKQPATATYNQIKALAYMWPRTVDLLMLRNQQIRLLKDRLENLGGLVVDLFNDIQRLEQKLLIWQCYALMSTLALPAIYIWSQS